MLTRFVHARVFQGDGSFCDSFVTENGLFAMTGSASETLQAYPQTSTVDLGGRFVCAGFNDSHMHLLGLGTMLSMAQLADATDSLAHMLAAIGEFAKAHPDHPFVLGRGWNQDYFADCNRFPTRDDLDSVCPERPCLITRACGHIAVANSAALKLAGISDVPVPVDGGVVENLKVKATVASVYKNVGGIAGLVTGGAALTKVETVEGSSIVGVGGVGGIAGRVTIDGTITDAKNYASVTATTGAAGGMGFAFLTFTNATLQSGIQIILEETRLEEHVKDADIVITGEGRLDGQTLRGKAVCGVAKRAKALGVPAIALVGGSEGDLTPLYDEGLTAAVSINRLPQPLEESVPHAAEHLAHTMDNVLRLLEVSP